MKKILIIALLLVFAATSALAVGITWFGQKDYGRIGLGVSRDGIGFIAFEDVNGALTYIWADDYYGDTYGLAHKICITHGPALFTAHSTTTEQGWFNLRGAGRPLRNWAPRDPVGNNVSPGHLPGP